jgi:hypothetical protein
LEMEIASRDEISACGRPHHRAFDFGRSFFVALSFERKCQPYILEEHEVSFWNRYWPGPSLPLSAKKLGGQVAGVTRRGYGRLLFSQQLSYTERNKRVAWVGTVVRVVKPEETEDPAVCAVRTYLSAAISGGRPDRTSVCVRRPARR